MDEMFGWKTKTRDMNRRAPEVSGACDGGLHLAMQGLMAGTRVASNLGWRSVEALAVGDSVLTFDGGMQEITEVRRMTLCFDRQDTPAALWPMVVPVGALDNRVALTLLPDQGVLVESDAAHDMFGDPFAVIPVAALEGVRGIRRAGPPPPIELVALYFAAEQVIYAEGGALIHCAAHTTTLDRFLDGRAAYDVLGARDAAYVAECLVIEDQVLATGGWCDAQGAVHC